MGNTLVPWMSDDRQFCTSLKRKARVQMEDKAKEVDKGAGRIYAHDINARIMSETSQQKVIAISFVICTVGAACSSQHKVLCGSCPPDLMRRRHNS